MEKEQIVNAIKKLSATEKVDILVEVYWTLTASQKDRFLEETENS